MSRLEDIAMEFNRGEERDPKILLNLLNEHYQHTSIGPIFNLDEIRGYHATPALARILSISQSRSKQLKDKLVSIGVFSQNLVDYSISVQEAIIKNIIQVIERSFPYRSASYYLREENPFAETNRKIIINSKQFKDYLLRIGISHLDDVRNVHANRVHARLLGFKDIKHFNRKEMQQKLVGGEVFSSDLADSSYDNLREDICQNLIDRLYRKWDLKTSYYISLQDTRIRQSNIEVILASKAVQNLFAEEGYYINYPSTMTRHVKNFLIKYFGSYSIDDIIAQKTMPRTQERGREPLYRLIEKEWLQEEEEILRGMKSNLNEEDFIGLLREQRKVLQEQFGVSYLAIISKCQYMGLISKEERGGSRETGTPKYAFPRIHEEEFADLVKGFENYAALLARNIIPAATPAFTYESATHRQFDHVTLPVYWKGTDPKKYNRAEQAVISAAWHSISDNISFERNDRKDLIIDPSTRHSFEPVVLQIQGEYASLIQLIFRKRFNPDNKVGTFAISIGNGREIYLFKHEKNPTYENTRL